MLRLKGFIRVYELRKRIFAKPAIANSSIISEECQLFIRILKLVEKMCKFFSIQFRKSKKKLSMKLFKKIIIKIEISEKKFNEKFRSEVKDRLTVYIIFMDDFKYLIGKLKRKSQALNKYLKMKLETLEIN